MVLLCCLCMTELYSEFDSSVKVVLVVFEMALQSSSFLLQLVQTNAVELFGFLLEKVSPQHLTLDLLSSIFSFVGSLLRDPGGSELAWQVIEGLLFNPALWIRADKTVSACTMLFSHSYALTHPHMHPPVHICTHLPTYSPTYPHMHLRTPT